MTNVVAAPAPPVANQPVTVTATITGQTSAVLRYRVDFNAEQTVTMTPSGTDTYSATIPGAAAGDLIRYRVQATNANATTLSPRVDDTIVYRGLVVPHGISSPVPVIEWFIADADYNLMVQNPLEEIVRFGAIAYNGQVIDNVEMNIKGHASRQNPKVSWKFHTPQGYDLSMPGLLIDPVDEFDLQADWADKAHGRAILSWDAFQRAGTVPDHQMFPVRAQRNGAFQALYNLQDTYDGTWRERWGYDDDQFYEAETSAFSTRPIDVQFSKKSPDKTDFAPIAAFVNGVRLTGNAQRDYLLANADLPQMINYAAVTAIVEHVDSSSKNFYMSQDPVTGRWSILPWDLDHSLGNGCCQVNSTFVTPAEPGDSTSALMRALLVVPQWRDMYFRRLRTLVNDLLATGRMEAVYDATLGPAQSTAALDFAAWPYTNNPNYAQQRTRLFNDIQSRRNVFAGDARVPGNQPAAEHPDRRDPALPNEWRHRRVRRALQPGRPGDRPVRLDDLRGHRPGHPAGDRDPAGICDDVRQQRPGVPGRLRRHRLRRKPLRGQPRGLRDAHPDPAGQLDSRRGDVRRCGLAGPRQRAVARAERPLGRQQRRSQLGPVDGFGHPRQHPGPDVTVPGSPTIGTASPGNASATVRWTAPFDNGGSAVTGYSVRVLNNAEQQVGALRPAGATATSLVVTGLANGTAYHFQVAATNSAGTGALSGSSNTVTPTAGATAPAPRSSARPARARSEGH